MKCFFCFNPFNPFGDILTSVLLIHLRFMIIHPNLPGICNTHGKNFISENRWVPLSEFGQSEFPVNSKSYGNHKHLWCVNLPV